MCLFKMYDAPMSIGTVDDLSDKTTFVTKVMRSFLKNERNTKVMKNVKYVSMTEGLTLYLYSFGAS